MRKLHVWWMAALAGGFCFAAAARALPPQAQSLQEKIEAIERMDGELARAKEDLKAASTAAELKRIQARLKELAQNQEVLLKELEAMVGPGPAAVRSEAPHPLEESGEIHQKRLETTLESNVEQRLRSQ